MNRTVLLTARAAALLTLGLTACTPPSTPPATQPPVTQPPVTQPPATTPPSTQPPAASGATIIYKGSSTTFDSPGLTASVRADGLVAYMTFGGSGKNLYLYDGASRKIKTTADTDPEGFLNSFCTDRNGDVVLLGNQKLFLYSGASGSLTRIPFPAVDGRPVKTVVCAPDGSIIGSETSFKNGAETEYS